MAKKSKKPSERSYNIKGGIKAGHDVIMGDQNISIQHIANIQTSAQFVEELQKLQEEISRMKQDSSLTSAEKRRVEVVRADVQDAIDEAKKPAPLADRINKALDNARDIMEKLGGSFSGAITLGTRLAEFAGLALRLFGH